MQIAFAKNKKIEYFNGTKQPIGTAFTTLYNQLSSLTFNKKFELGTYKDVNLSNYYYIVLAKLRCDKISEIIGIENNYNIDTIKQDLKIQNIDVNFEEFQKLVTFCIHLDEFISLAEKDKRILKQKKILFFFTGIHDYKIPNVKTENEDTMKQYNNELLKKNANNINEIYNNIIESDKNILSEILNSENLIYTFDCEDFIQLLLVSYIFILSQNLNLKRCRFCGRFFIANHGKEEFCNNNRPRFKNENMKDYLKTKISCKEYNKKIYYNDNLDGIKKAKRRIKQNIQKRIREKKETKEYLKEWEKNLIKKRKKLISNEKYIEWILYESDIHGKRRSKNGSSRTNKK